MKVYYAHSMGLYRTPQEERDLVALRSLGFEVVNPSDEQHKLACERIRAARPLDPSGAAMVYFVDLVRGCDALAFRANPDGKIGAGVVGEIQAAQGGGLPVFELPHSLASRFLSIEQTREYLREVGQR